MMIDSWQGAAMVENYELVAHEIKAMLFSLKAAPMLKHTVISRQYGDPELYSLMNRLYYRETILDWIISSDKALRFQGMIVVPNLEEVRRAVLDEAHFSRLTIHPGGTKMYHNIKHMYWWKGLKSDVVAYVARCPVCIFM